MKLVQINPVIRSTTSTGKIMKGIAAVATEAGWESYAAYSRGRDGVPAGVDGLLPVGDKVSVAFHLLLTRLFDLHGRGSVVATRRFVKRLRSLDPDVIHIHNIHGYFLNYRILFDYLASAGKPVIWTVHDCWLYTGHCYHYASAGCDRWQSHCGDCPQRKAFPSSWIADRSYRNFDDKRRAFTSVPSFTVVTVSEWMKNEMSRSFLKGCRFEVIHNGIDTDTFSPQEETGLREKLGIGDRRVILGVASLWNREKGLEDFARLDSMVDHDREVIVLVGIKEGQKAELPRTIITVARTADVSQLAELYSMADVLANPTWQDNYPTVNMEAISCGTPVVTYRTGGSVETINGETGFVVEQGDVKAMLDCIRGIEAAGKEAWRDGCRRFALENFRQQERFGDYLKLYQRLRDENTSVR